MLERAWLDDLKVHDVAELGASSYALRGWNGLDLPAPRKVFRPRPRAHGHRDRSRFYEARVLELSGYAKGPTPGDTAELVDELKARIALDDSLHTFRFRRVGRTEDEELYFRTADFAAPQAGYVETVRWDATCVAEDPRLFSSTLKSTFYDPTSAVVGNGAPMPLSFPLDFSGAGASSTLTVDNAGNYETPPRYTVRGPASAIVIDNETTGESIFSTGLALADGDELEIDVATRTVWLAGTLRQDLIDAAQTRWGELVRGENLLRLRGAGFSSGLTRLTVEWRDARV